MASAKKRANGKHIDEAMAGATEKVLKQITELYESGLSPGAPGSIGLKSIAESPMVQLQLRKPRKKVTVMIVGNHSAGKSSFINWYIGESIQKTGVAIETRGFTFVTSGKKRETLTGEATGRYFDYLSDFTKIEGITPNLFTEISTSKAKNFSCTDLVDSPGLVDGDMLYPFSVEDAIMQMAEHVDLVLVFLDPIGQATCRRTMQVVERLNNSAHLERVRYFMSKADAVEKEHDRQRVLIQITQNLATRIRNSHAFNLPTFYLPREDGSDPGIPNAIEEVCQEIDKVINMSVQKNLQKLKEDCEKTVVAINAARQADKEKRAKNFANRLKGSMFFLAATAMLALMALLLTARILPSLCKVSEQLCEASHAKLMVHLQPVVVEHFTLLGGVQLLVFLVFAIIGKLTWKVTPVFTKAELKKLDEYQQVVVKIGEQEAVLYEDYFNSLSHPDSR